MAAQSAAAAKFNEETAGLLREFIADDGGWSGALPPAEIFELFQSWCEAKHGRRHLALSKHRISKVLVDSLGATWHKTGKGRLYTLPDSLRPAAPSEGGDKEIPVPVVPSTPRPDADSLAGRNSVAVPAPVVELAARAAEATPAAPPFVDLPEFGNGSEVVVTEGGAFDAVTGSLLPGDGPSPLEEQLLALTSRRGPEQPAEGGPGDPDYDADQEARAAAYADEAPAVEQVDSVYSSPAVREAVAAEVARARAAEEAVSPPSAEEQMAQDDAAMEELSVLEAARPPAAVEDEVPGVRPFSLPLTEDQAKYLPAVRLLAMLDEKIAAAGMVRIGSKEDVVVRKVGSTPYATILAAPAGSVPAAAAAVASEEVAWAAESAAVEAAADAALQVIEDPEMPVGQAVFLQAPVEEPATPAERVGGWYEDGLHYRVPLDRELAEAPFAVLEAAFVAGLPAGAQLAHGGAVEVRDLADGLYVTGPAVVPAAVAVEPAPAVGVSGEDLQGLVGGEPEVDYSAEEAEYEEAAAVVPDAASVALAAYRAASAGLSLPDHIADPGDWA